MKESVLIVYASPLSAEAFDSLHEKLSTKDSSKEFLIISGHLNPSRHSINIFESFNYPQKLDLTCKDIFEETGVDAAYLYESDQDYMFKRKPTDFFIQKTLFGLKKIKELQDKYNITHVFSVGGGSMITNLFIEYFSRVEGIKCRRFPQFKYLNGDHTLPRVGCLADNKFNLTEEQTNSKAEQWAIDLAENYYNQIKSKKLLPDKVSRKFAQSGLYSPKNFLVFSKYLFILIAKYIVNFFLDKNSKKATFEPSLLVRSYLARKIISLRYFVKPVSIPKFPYFIFILHHPIDSQISFRGRAFRDQISTARLIAKNLPANTALLVKEHPVFPGSTNVKDILRLESEYPNVRFLDSSFLLSDFLSQCTGVITVNSTAGLEAMIHGIPVVAIGSGFYSNMNNIYNIKDFGLLTNTLSEVIYNKTIPSKNDFVEMLSNLLKNSYPKRATTKEDDMNQVFADAIFEESR